MDVRVDKYGDIEFRGEARDVLMTLNKKQLELIGDVTSACSDNRASTALRMKEVIFHGPATIIYWEDGDKTVVKCMEGDHMNPEMGIAMATLKKMLGGSYKEFKKHTAEIIAEDKKRKLETKLNKYVKEIKEMAEAVKELEDGNEQTT